jgi:ADP-heptose:LPS heptosyltransferase
MISLNAKKILVCLRYGIGDVVMELPALHALRQTCRGAQITALGAFPALQVLNGDWRVDRLESVHRWGLSHWGDTGNNESRMTFSKWLEQERYDLLLDPSHAVSGIREEIWAAGGNILDTGGGLHERMLQMGVEGHRAIKGAIRKGWGLPVPWNMLPELSLLPRERSFAQTFLKSRGLEHALLIGFSPVASSPLKRWPLEKMAWVMDGLLKESNGHGLLLCGPQVGSAEQLLRAMRHRDKVTVVGSVHLRLVGALLARLALLLCNDTGLMHLGAAVSIPVLAMFGPTSPGIYTPPGARTVIFDREADGCPTRRTRCFGPGECLVQGRCLNNGSGCIGDIGREEVLRAGLEMLSAISMTTAGSHLERESA